jgi:hypothetical protein
MTARRTATATSVKSAAARPELAKALALCKKREATLVIARLDRLARNVHFTLAPRANQAAAVCAAVTGTALN